jgi:hypothetical protein
MSTVDNIERRLDRLEGGEVETRCAACADWRDWQVHRKGADGLWENGPDGGKEQPVVPRCAVCGWTPTIIVLERVDVIHAKRDITADLV